MSDTNTETAIERIIRADDERDSTRIRCDHFHELPAFWGIARYEDPEERLEGMPTEDIEQLIEIAEDGIESRTEWVAIMKRELDNR